MPVEIKVNQREQRRISQTLNELPRDIQLANEKGLSGFGFFVSRQIGKYIDSNFTNLSVLASKYQNTYFGDYKGSKTNPWRRRILKNKGAFRFLSKFANYVNLGDSVKVSYGNRDSIKRKEFDRKLLRIAKRMERGASYRVTPKMRRFSAMSGIPFKKTTTQIKVKKRPVIRPVFNATKNQALNIYRDKVIAKISKGYLNEN